MQSDRSRMDRRNFLKTTAAGIGAAAVGGSLLGNVASAAEAAAKVDAKNLIWRSKVPTMQYQRLGRTNFMCSRIVQGFAGDVAVWRRLLDRGVNYWDTGWGYGEGNHEKALKPFLAKSRDNKLWITSKATGIAGYNKIDEGVRELYLKAMKAYLGTEEFDKLAGKTDKKGQVDLLVFHDAAVAKEKKTSEKPDLRPIGKRMAEMYLVKLDESLSRMGIETVDAYFMHGVEIPWFWDCLEVWEAYEKAHKAGKVKHFGFSTHTHQQPVLAAAAVANEKGPWRIDLMMPGVNPVTFDEWRTELDALKKQDVGIVAMKTTGLKGCKADGKMDKLKEASGGREYNEWERCKLFMLHLTDGTIDSVIAAMKSNEEMEKDLPLAGVKLSAAAKRELNTIVRGEMASTCNLCGECTVHCPEHIAVADMVRYHAYMHQYNDQELARHLYTQAGYDPASMCTNCGSCANVCKAGVQISQILQQLSSAMA